MLNQDFKDMLRCLLDANVEFLLIGGYALAAHGYPRATKDMDIWVWPKPDNAARLMRALAAFGAPLNDLDVKDFSDPGNVFQIGLPPRRIDITTVADGVDFAQCWSHAAHVQIDELRVPLIAVEDLIANKRATARPQDIVDADVLSAATKT